MLRKSIFSFLAAILFLFFMSASGFSQLDTSLPWPKFHYGINNTGKTENYGTLIGGLKWDFQTGAAVTSSPALDDDTLYIGSADNYFYALDQDDGTLKWRVKTAAPIQRSSPAIDTAGIVYVGSDDGFLWAFDTDPSIVVADPTEADERILWVFSTAGAINSSPSIDPAGNIIFSSNDGYIYSVDTGGNQNWRTEIGASWCPPAIDSGLNRAYIGSWEYQVTAIAGPPSKNKYSNLFSINLTNGAIVWGFPGDLYSDAVATTDYPPGGVLAGPVISPDGRLISVFFKAWDWSSAPPPDPTFSDYLIVKLNKSDTVPLSLTWPLFELGGNNIYSTPAVLEDNSVFIASGNNLFRIFPDATQYYSVLTAGDRIESSPAIDNRKTVYVGSNGGYFYAIGADSPETPIIWQYPREGESPLQTGSGSVASIISSPAIGADAKRSVYVGASDGKVYAFYDSPRISGNVTYKGQPLSGVTITLQGGSFTKTETTSDAGWYEFKDIDYDTYTVTPSFDGYVFDPTSESVVLNASNDDQTADFTARRYEITGKVVDTTGTGLNNITVKITGAGISIEKQTNAAGEYTFDDLEAGSYTVAAISTGYKYTPLEISVSNLNSDRVLSNIVATVVTGLTISGKIKHHDTKLGIENIQVTLTGDCGVGTVTTNTDNCGYYFFTGLDGNCTYNVTPTTTGYIYNPENIVLEDMTEDKEDQDFEATPLTGLTISGKIRSSITGLGIGGIEVELMGDGGFVAETTTTETDGSYTFTGLTSRTYNVAPTTAGYAYSPTVLEVRDLSADKTDADFTATPLTGLTISGKVRSSVTGLGIGSITVELSGDGGFATTTTTTGTDGSYTFTGLTSRTYNVAPTTAGYAYSPTVLEVRDLSADKTDADFTAAPLTGLTISGKIKDANTALGIAGIVVELTGDGGFTSVTTTTNASGNYVFSGLGSRTYNVKPTSIGYVYDPPLIIIENMAADTVLEDIKATEGDIVGTVTDAISSQGISGVTIELYKAGLPRISSNLVDVTSTDADGKYVLINLEKITYTVVPTHSGYYFTPSEETVTVSSDGAKVVNFRAGKGLQIAGRITDATTGAGLEGIAVNLSGMGLNTSRTTDAEGVYEFLELDVGTYTITPVDDNYNFEPVSRSVTISTENLMNVNFSGSRGFEIAGKIRDEQGQGIKNITVNLIKAGYYHSAITDVNGTYIFSKLERGDYTVYPVHSSYKFTPISIAVSISTKDHSDVDFTGYIPADFPLADTPWPKFHRDLKNTGKTNNFGTLVGNLKWKFQTGAAITSSPALSDDTLYVGSADNYFYALNTETGELRWRYKTGGAISFTSPAIDKNEVVFIGSNDGYLYAFDTINIDVLNPLPLWRFKTNGAISSSPSFDANNVIFTSSDGYLYAVDRTDGSEIWRRNIGSSWVSPAVDGRIYTGSWSGAFFSINNDGTREWEFPNFCIPGGVLASPVIAFDDSIISSYMTTYADECDDDLSEYNIYKLDITGNLKWALDIGGNDMYSTPAVLEDNSIFIASGNQVYKILPDAGTYFSVATVGGRIESSPAIDGRKTVYVGSNGGYFYAIGADSPETPILWQYPKKGEPPLQTDEGSIASIISSPAIGAGRDDRNSVYVGASDGCIYAFFDGSRIVGKVELVQDGAKVPLSGVKIVMENETAPDMPDREALTDPNGEFEFAGVDENFTYTLIPEKIGYIFSPLSQTVTVRQAGDVNVLFQASYGKTVSGVVTDSDGNLLAGVNILLEGDNLGYKSSQVTDSNGKYEFTGLGYDTYTITPSFTGYGFTPPFRSVVISPTDPPNKEYTDLDFTATTGFQISGKVVDAIKLEGFQGVRITLKSVEFSDSTTTDESGAYSFVGLTGGTYTVTPQYAAYDFEPQEKTVVLAGANVDNIDFIAGSGAAISGVVLAKSDKTPLEGVFVALYENGLFEDPFSKAPVRTYTTGENGKFNFIGVEPNKTYHIKPSKEGYGFDPSFIKQNVLGSSAISDIYFEAIEGYYISGTVTNLVGAGVSDVDVSLSGEKQETVQTNEQGQYSFSALGPGTYTVTVEAVGYSVYPASKNVIISTSGKDDINFTLSMECPYVLFNLPFYGGRGSIVNIFGMNFGFAPSDPPKSVNIEGVTLEEGIYFGGIDPNTWVKTEVIDWSPVKAAVYAPSSSFAFPIVHVWVVRLNEATGQACYYAQPFFLNFFISGW